MAVSVIPALVDALFAAATAALPDVNVYDGYGVTADPGDFLMIGIDNPFSDSRASAATSQQDWANVGTSADRDETGQIMCTALSWNGDGDPQAARNAVFTISEAVATICRGADPSLGVASLLWTSFGTQFEFDQDQDSTGAYAVLSFQILFRSRI